MFLAETILIWVAVLAYAASAALRVVEVIFARARAGKAASSILWLGFIAHAAAIAIRWIRLGQGPYLGFYEVSSLLSFITVALLLWLSWKWPAFRVAGVVVIPVAFLLIGGSMLVSREAGQPGSALDSMWLVVHVLFANLAYGAYVAAFTLSVAYLMRDYGRGAGRLQPLLESLPENTLIDSLTFRFVGAGFIFQGIMIASGAIWANEAWGRYWGWDAIETWSLIAWAVYAIYLHLRLTMGWSGRKAAWVAVIALPVIVFSLLGVPLFYGSIHAGYLFT